MTPQIPREFHFIFGLQKQREPFHLCHYLCIESCYRVNRPHKIFFHYHHEPYGPYWELAKRRVVPERIRPSGSVSWFAYGIRHRRCRRYRYAHHADFIRLELLNQRGGIYADIDTIFVNPIPPRLYHYPFVLGKEDDIFDPDSGKTCASLCNAFIMAPEHSEFGGLWLHEMKHRFNGSWSAHSTVLPHKLSQTHPQLLHIEPSRTFYKHMWTRQGIRMLLRGCDRDYRGVVSMHLWSHLWWSEERRDFTDFHAGLLTEDYIRQVDTTYNLVAREYLP